MAGIGILPGPRIAASHGFGDLKSDRPARAGACHIRAYVGIAYGFGSVVKGGDGRGCACWSIECAVSSYRHIYVHAHGYIGRQCGCTCHCSDIACAGGGRTVRSRATCLGGACCVSVAELFCDGCGVHALASASTQKSAVAARFGPRVMLIVVFSGLEFMDVPGGKSTRLRAKDPRSYVTQRFAP